MWPPTREEDLSEMYLVYSDSKTSNWIYHRALWKFWRSIHIGTGVLDCHSAASSPGTLRDRFDNFLSHLARAERGLRGFGQITRTIPSR